MSTAQGLVSVAFVIDAFTRRILSLAGESDGLMPGLSSMLWSRPCMIGVPFMTVVSCHRDRGMQGKFN